MPPVKSAPKEAAPPAAPKPKYSVAELLEVKHLGPALIGQEMYDAKEAYLRDSQGGVFGPALRGEVNEGAPVKA